MREIRKEDIELLLDKKIIRNTNKGFIDKRGYTVGFYKTRNKRYIEDKYVSIANRLSQKAMLLHSR